MNANILKAKSLSKKQAYILFIFQAHYAYVGKWWVQILYWLSWMAFPFFIIWPINQFFAIPNTVKRHNLKVYDEFLQKYRS